MKNKRADGQNQDGENSWRFELTAKMPRTSVLSLYWRRSVRTGDDQSVLETISLYWRRSVCTRDDRSRWRVGVLNPKNSLRSWSFVEPVLRNKWNHFYD